MTVIDLSEYRRSRKIVAPAQYDDERIEFARRVEERAFALWQRQMSGEKPGDTE